MENKRLLSEQLSEVLRLFDQVQKDYDWSVREETRLEQLTQDYLHMLELDNISYRGRARVAKALKECRMERRLVKDQAAITKLVVDFLTGEKGKMMIPQMQQVLGKVRKEENYIARRTYTPKVLSREESELFK